MGVALFLLYASLISQYLIVSQQDKFIMPLFEVKVLEQERSHLRTSKKLFLSHSLQIGPPHRPTKPIAQPAPTRKWAGLRA